MFNLPSEKWVCIDMRDCCRVQPSDMYLCMNVLVLQPDSIPLNDMGPGYAPLDEPRPHKKPVGGVPLFPNLPPVIMPVFCRPSCSSSCPLLCLWLVSVHLGPAFSFFCSIRFVEVFFPSCVCDSFQLPIRLATTVCLRGLTWCVLYFLVSRQWHSCWCLGFLTCTQVFMHAVVNGGCTNTILH